MIRSHLQVLIGSRSLSWMDKDPPAFWGTFSLKKPIFTILAGVLVSSDWTLG